MPTDLPRINLTLSQPLYDLLRRMADLNNISMSGLVSSMLEAHTHQLTMLLDATEVYTKTNNITNDALELIFTAFRVSLNRDVAELNDLLTTLSSEIAATLPTGAGGPDRAPARTGAARPSKASGRLEKASSRSPGGAPPLYSNTGVTPARKASHGSKRAAGRGHR